MRNGSVKGRKIEGLGNEVENGKFADVIIILLNYLVSTSE